jgi:ribosome-binding factor A
MRTNKVAQEIRRVVSDLFQEGFDDPKLQFVSITRVAMTADLKIAKLYISTFPDENMPDALFAIHRMKGYFRNELAERTLLKYIPELVFFPDEGIKYSVDIAQRIEEIKRELGYDSLGT